jgi:hypothetical protein
MVEMEDTLNWLKDQFMDSKRERENKVFDKELGTDRMNCLPACQYAHICLLLPVYVFVGEQKSFATQDLKKQRALSIACVREEMQKGNLVLKAGGIRSHVAEQEVCVVALGQKLRGLGYKDYCDLLDDSIKHALASVLKTEGRKAEDKQVAYKTMLERGKARVQRWRLSARMLAAMIADMVLQGISAEERAKKEEVCVLVTDFWFSSRVNAPSRVFRRL